MKIAKNTKEFGTTMLMYAGKISVAPYMLPIVLSNNRANSFNKSIKTEIGPVAVKGAFIGTGLGLTSLLAQSVCYIIYPEALTILPTTNSISLMYEGARTYTRTKKRLTEILDNEFSNITTLDVIKEMWPENMNAKSLYFTKVAANEMKNMILSFFMISSRMPIMEKYRKKIKNDSEAPISKYARKSALFTGTTLGIGTLGTGIFQGADYPVEGIIILGGSFFGLNALSAIYELGKNVAKSFNDLNS